MENRIKILIVDDEARFLTTLARRLTLRNFDVTAVGSGEEAVSAARAKDFDVAIVDLKMPGMTGEEVLAELKQDHPLIEVVILTGHGSVESAVECIQAGSAHYLQKPCETDKLLAVLNEAFEKRMKKKIAMDQDKANRLMELAVGESPLGILRKLKEIERE